MNSVTVIPVPALNDPVPDLDRICKDCEVLGRILTDVAYSRAQKYCEDRGFGMSPQTLQALATGLVPALFTSLGAWLGSHKGRKVYIKIEAEAQTWEELEKLLDRAQVIQQLNQSEEVGPEEPSNK